jgi:hypothetical protein
MNHSILLRGYTELMKFNFSGIAFIGGGTYFQPPIQNQYVYKRIRRPTYTEKKGIQSPMGSSP